MKVLCDLDVRTRFLLVVCLFGPTILINEWHSDDMEVSLAGSMLLSRHQCCVVGDIARDFFINCILNFFDVSFTLKIGMIYSSL